MHKYPKTEILKKGRKIEMIKRIILPTLTVFLTANGMADEFFLGGSYDFHRKANIKINGTKKIKQGFKLRAEWLPFERNNLKIGTGIAHGFDFKQKNDKEKVNFGNITSVYGIIKPEWKINDEWKVYNKYKLGLSFSSGKKFEKIEADIKSSGFKSKLYAGIEAGIEWKNFSLGLTYDINNSGVKYAGKNNQIHQMGIVIGYVFGNEKKYKSEFVSTVPVKTVSGTGTKETPRVMPIQNEKNIEVNETPKIDYKKWFSFDEEINK